MNSKALLKKAIKRTSKNAVIKQLKQFKKTHPQYKKRASQLIRFARFGGRAEDREIILNLKNLIRGVNIRTYNKRGPIVTFHLWKQTDTTPDESVENDEYNKMIDKQIGEARTQIGPKDEKDLVLGENGIIQGKKSKSNSQRTERVIKEAGISDPEEPVEPETLTSLQELLNKLENSLGKGKHILPNKNRSFSLLLKSYGDHGKLKKEHFIDYIQSLEQPPTPPDEPPTPPAGPPPAAPPTKPPTKPPDEKHAALPPPAPPTKQDDADAAAALPPPSPEEPLTPPRTETPTKTPAGSPDEKAVLLKLKGVGDELAKQIEGKIKDTRILLKDRESLSEPELQMLKNSMTVAEEAASEFKKKQVEDEKSVGLSLKLNNLQNALDNLTTNIDSLLERIADKTQAHKEKIAEQENKIAGLEKKLTDQEQKISEVQKSKLKITEKMNAANQEKEKTEEFLASARKQLSEKEDELKRIVAEHDSLKKQLESNSLEAQKELKELEQQYLAIDKEKTDLVAKIRNLESENAAQKAQISKSEDALQESKETISRQNTDIASLKGEIVGLKEKQEAEHQEVIKQSGNFQEISQKNLDMWEALKMVILMSNLGQRGQEIIQTSKNEIIRKTDDKITEWTEQIDALSNKIMSSFGKLRKKHKNPKKILLKNIELHYKAYRKLW
tara:strand:+ start:3881 stop:5893 length:2013 start_codon:yes stop_codon:yes gene_type:complete